jgi:hypothetical protein
MTPTEDQMDALTETITRLRAENARLREAGREMVAAWDSPFTPDVTVERLGAAIIALRAALKEGAEE